MRKLFLLFAFTLLLIGLVSGAFIQSYWQTANVKTQGRIEDPLEAWSESDIVVWQYNSTFFASRNMSTLTVMQLVANASQVLSNAVGNASSAKGSVYVRNGTYTASVTLKTNVWLTLDKGASGITVTIDAGATAWLVDGNAGRIRWWKAGSLVWDANMDAGTLTAASGLFSSWMNSTNINFTTLYMEGEEVQLVQPASFIIDVSGANYRAWHGSNSTLLESSTNASQVINDAIGNLSNTVGRTGGKVMIKHGTYLIDSNITFPTYVSAWSPYTVEGEDGQVELRATASGVTIFNVEKQPFVQIRNFYFTATDRSFPSNAIALIDPSEVLIEDCAFAGMNGTAINMQGAWGAWISNSYFCLMGDDATAKPVIRITGGSTQSESAAIKIQGCVMEDTNYYRSIEANQTSGLFVTNTRIFSSSINSNSGCIWFDGRDSSGGVNYGSLIVDTSYFSQLYNNMSQNLVYVTGTAKNVQFSECLFINGATQLNISSAERFTLEACNFQKGATDSTNYAIDVAQGYSIISSCQFGVDTYADYFVNLHGTYTGYSQIVNNKFVGRDSAAGIAINISDSSTYDIIEGNEFVNIGTGITLAANGATITGNVFTSSCTTPLSNSASFHKIYGNYGFVTEASGTWSGSSPVTVAHGCAGTPYVQITVNAVQPYSYSCTVNATHIVIYHNGFDVVSGWWDAHYVP